MDPADADADLARMIVDDVGLLASPGGSASGASRAGSEDLDREAIFMPAVQSLVAALGGFEDVPNARAPGGVETVYRPGDSALAVLRDLKRLWRKDDTDDERTVARCFARAGLARELIALLEECAERGEAGRKLALAAADLLAALTWPIDVAAELKELEDEPDVVTDYATLLRAQVEYKAMFVRTGEPLRCMMVLMLPSLSKHVRDLTDRDKKIVSLMLHLVRNLLHIRDPPPSTTGPTTSLQTDLVAHLERHEFFTLLHTLAAQAGRREWDETNVLVLDVLWGAYRGVDAHALSQDQRRAPADALKGLLDDEDAQRRAKDRRGTSRHSRFGTTITVRAGAGAKYILHRQAAVSQSAGAILDTQKRARVSGVKREGRGEAPSGELGVEAMEVLQRFAGRFVDGCFNVFFESILKDIRMSRSKVRETDNLRALVLTRLFADYFLIQRQRHRAEFLAAREKRRALRAKEREARRAERVWEGLMVEKAAAVAAGAGPSDADNPLGEGPSSRPMGGADGAAGVNAGDGAADDDELDPEDEDPYAYGVIGVMAQEDTIRWMQRRLAEALDGKIKWIELQACMNSISNLLNLTEGMAADEDDTVKEAASVVRDKIFYDAQTLECAVQVLRLCHDRPLGCQEIAVDFAYVLLRTLEKYSQTQEYIHVRKKRNRRRLKAANSTAADDSQDEEAAAMDNAMPSYQEHRRTFRQFEEKYLTEEVASTLIHHTSRYRDFRDPDHLKRCVGLMHRIAVKRQAEGVFFKVSNLRLFKLMTDDKVVLPKLPSGKDLQAFVNYILRKFFKAINAQPLLIVEALFPLPKSVWKEHSTYESDHDDGLDEAMDRIRSNRLNAIPAELEFKPDRKLSWTEQMGVAIRCLLDNGNMHLVTWLLDAIGLVASTREEVILHTDGEPRVFDPELDDVRPSIGPSEDAKEKLEDHDIDFGNEEIDKAATFNAPFRLMLKLVSFDSRAMEEGATQLSWYVPRNVMPESLLASARIIEQFLREPFDLDGEDAADMLRKKRKKPVRKRRSPSVASDGEVRSRGPRKQAEVQQYKSAAFIEDSDSDEDRDREFFAKEAERRARHHLSSAMPAQQPASAGTNKRSRRAGRDSVSAARSASPSPSQSPGSPSPERDGDSAASSAPGETSRGSPYRSASYPAQEPPQHAASARPRPRARPRRRFDPDLEEEGSEAASTRPGLDASLGSDAAVITRKRRVLAESEDDD